MQADDDDPAAPQARAERLSSVDGHVQTVQGDQVIADPAIVNAPLFEGTQVVTFEDGKAEVEFEDGSVARLSPNSSLTLSVLKPEDGPGGTEVRLDSGLGYFELQSGQSGHMQVRFGDAVVTANGFTVLRVDLDNAPGRLAVFSGNAHVERGSAISVDMHGGESLSLNTQDLSKYDLAETIEPDSWDTWNADRDQVLTAEASSRTEATQSFPDNSNPAWNDLDANGNWYNVPGSGYVWSPYDATTPGWDPYGNGNWMWTPGYGYMWVSGDSWGYLPFACGMWSFYDGFGWGWSPGAGACSPWWGGGGSIWVVNIVRPPFGYLPPRMPHRPVRLPVAPGRRNGPYPLIAVNKRPPSGFGFTQQRPRNVSATIGGHVVMPVHAISPRPVYDRTVTTFGNRAPVPVMRAPNGEPMPGRSFGGTRAPVAMPAPAPAPRSGSSIGQRPALPPPSRPSGGGAPPSHAPSGGGGGAAPHGGGGGGSPHH